jgi:hypothetical protein
MMSERVHISVTPTISARKQFYIYILQFQKIYDCIGQLYQQRNSKICTNVTVTTIRWN